MTLAELTVIASEVVQRVPPKLPADIRVLADKVPVHFEATPADDVLAEGFPPDILGLFSGNSHGAEAEASATPLPQIVLYVENIWDLAEGDLRAFRDEIKVTYLHELGHYLGWDEDELTTRGLE